jgi:hypothetical protein
MFQSIWRVQTLTILLQFLVHKQVSTFKYFWRVSESATSKKHKWTAILQSGAELEAKYPWCMFNLAIAKIMSQWCPFVNLTWCIYLILFLISTKNILYPDACASVSHHRAPPLTTMRQQIDLILIEFHYDGLLIPYVNWNGIFWYSSHGNFHEDWVAYSKNQITCF